MELLLSVWLDTNPFFPRFAPPKIYILSPYLTAECRWRGGGFGPEMSRVIHESSS